MWGAPCRNAVWMTPHPPRLWPGCCCCAASNGKLCRFRAIPLPGSGPGRASTSPMALPHAVTASTLRAGAAKKRRAAAQQRREGSGLVPHTCVRGQACFREWGAWESAFELGRRVSSGLGQQHYAPLWGQAVRPGFGALLLELDRASAERGKDQMQRTLHAEHQTPLPSNAPCLG